MAGFPRKPIPNRRPEPEGFDGGPDDGLEPQKFVDRLPGNDSGCGLRNEAHRSADGEVHSFINAHKRYVGSFGRV